MASKYASSGCESCCSPESEGHDEEPLPGAHVLLPCRQALEAQPEAAGDDGRDDERPDRLAVAECDRDRERERQAEVLDECADEIESGADVDADRLAACRSSQARRRDHSARSTVATRDDSVNTITRS